MAVALAVLRLPRSTSPSLPPLLSLGPSRDHMSCNLQLTLRLHTRPECAAAAPGTGPKVGLWSPVLMWGDKRGFDTR